MGSGTRGTGGTTGELRKGFGHARQRFSLARDIAPRHTAEGPRADAPRILVAAIFPDGGATGAALIRRIRKLRARREVVGRELPGLGPAGAVSLVDRQG